MLMTILSLFLLSLALVPATPGSATQVEPGDPLVLAHFYIWFEPSSWNRAKSDYPLIRRYSSDEESVMREQVQLAKGAGIDGFIVSWKSTEVLDPRLEMLIAIAEEEDFKLAITYQALDFNRDPLPVARISADLDTFVQEYASSPAFDLFENPLVVWTGTEEFGRDEVALVVSQNPTLDILASEKSVDGYQRIGDLVAGNLYYWSSVNPETFPGYPGKLIEMGNAVRQNGGIWIAPAAPGYDTSLLGGKTVIPRNDGATLRAQWQGALVSVPDAIGIISWNEFSENTHIEPSVNYSTTALAVIADLTNAPRPDAIDFDSSAPEGSPERSSGVLRIVAFVFLGLQVLVSVAVVRRRQRHKEHTMTPSVG